MRFLVTGMPRCRTAWLTAVLLAHGAPAKHDVYALCRGSDEPCIVDPAVAMLEPITAYSKFCDDTIIMIEADDVDSRLDALERAGNVEFSPQTRSVYKRNLRTFRKLAHMIVNVKDLEDNTVVGNIVELCTRQAPSYEAISAFQNLKIVEHMEKVRLSASSTYGSTSPELSQTLRDMQSGTDTDLVERITRHLTQK